MLLKDNVYDWVNSEPFRHRHSECLVNSFFLIVKGQDLEDSQTQGVLLNWDIWILSPNSPPPTLTCSLRFVDGNGAGCFMSQDSLMSGSTF